MQNAQEPLILLTGELHTNKKFGADTINRGAALFECEWDGGVFESGLFVGGMFRSGQFAGGMFLGGIFLAEAGWVECGREGLIAQGYIVRAATSLLLCEYLCRAY